MKRRLKMLVEKLLKIVRKLVQKLVGLADEIMSSGAAPGDDDYSSSCSSSSTAAEEDLNSLSRKAERNAKLAIEADKNGETDFAFWRYIDAIEALRLMALTSSGLLNHHVAQ